jgi:hypothetical protein
MSTPVVVDVVVPGPIGAIDIVTGVPGPPGPMGPPGPAGVSNALYTDDWRWTTATSGAPATGYVGTNTGDFATATTLRLNKTSYPGTAYSPGRVKVGDDWYLQFKSDSTRYARYDITSLTDNGTWVSYGLTLIVSSGVPPGNNGTMSVSLIPQGVAVPQWLNGAGAPASTLGRDGDYYVNNTNGDVYTKSGGAWGSPITNIKGPTGPAGATNMTWFTVSNPATDVRPSVTNVLWVGGSTRPTNMAAGDLWVKTG